VINIAIIVSDFNSNITHELLNGAKTELLQAGLKENQIHVVHVPGAIEIPLIAKFLAKTKKYHAIIALGCVIRGETSHYDYVCQQVSEGCQKVMMKLEIPVIFGVLTTENEAQALARIGGAEGHKGKEAADAALKMVKLIETLQG
jgi:6,7-dimethyl-8-ribityllumazine synthase